MMVHRLKEVGRTKNTQPLRISDPVELIHPSVGLSHLVEGV